MTRLYRRLVHLLPWRIHRHLCELCDEFGTDPKVIAAAFDWLENVETGHTARPIGWHCEHMTITSAGLTQPPTGWCGCVMRPLLHDRTLTTAGNQP